MIKSCLWDRKNCQRHNGPSWEHLGPIKMNSARVQNCPDITMLNSLHGDGVSSWRSVSNHAVFKFPISTFLGKFRLTKSPFPRNVAFMRIAMRIFFCHMANTSRNPSVASFKTYLDFAANAARPQFTVDIIVIVIIETILIFIIIFI